MNYQDNESSDIYEDMKDNKQKDKSVNRHEPKSYKLGEEIANGVKYFGQEGKTDKGVRTCMCICPQCNELWRVSIRHIQTGNSKSCGCGNLKEDKH